MATPSLTVDQELKAAAQNLIVPAIADYDDESLEQALQYVDANDYPTLNGVEENEQALITAVEFHNKSAIRILLKHGASDKAIDKNGLSVMWHAVKNGDFSVVQTFISRDRTLAQGYVDGSMLSLLARNFSGCSLIQEPRSIWYDESSATPNVPVDKKILLDWFENKTKEAPKGKFRIKSAGPLNLADLLLGNGAQPWVPNINGVTPIMFAEHPEQYTYAFACDNADKVSMKYLKTVDGVVHIEVPIWNRNGSEKIMVTVERDYKPLLKKLQTHAAASPHAMVEKEASEILRTKIDESVKKHAQNAGKTAAEANEKVEKLRAAMTKVEHHQHKTDKTLAKVEENQKKTAEHQKKTDETLAYHGTLLTELYGPYADQKQFELKMKQIEANTGLSSFFGAVSKGVYTQLTAAMAIKSEKIKRENYAILDKVGAVVTHAAEWISLPLISGAAKGLGKLVEWGSSYRETNKSVNAIDNINVEIPKTCTLVALALIDKLKGITELDAATAKEMGKKAEKIIIDALETRDLSKSRAEPKALADALATIVVTDKSFTEKLTKVVGAANAAAAKTAQHKVNVPSVAPAAAPGINTAYHLSLQQAMAKSPANSTTSAAKVTKPPVPPRPMIAGQQQFKFA